MTNTHNYHQRAGIVNRREGRCMKGISYTYWSWVSSDETIWYESDARCKLCSVSENGESTKSFNDAADIARDRLSLHICKPTLLQRAKAWWAR